MNIDILIDHLQRVRKKGHNLPNKKIKCSLNFFEGQDEIKTIGLVCDMGMGDHVIILSEIYEIDLKIYARSQE